MCRALKVLCVAGDRSALAELKRAAVSAEWELGPGATTEDDAIRQLHLERPHVLIVFGSFPTLVERALEAYPSLRVITDRAIRGAVAVGSLEQVRAAVKPSNGPGGPVRAEPPGPGGGSPRRLERRSKTWSRDARATATAGTGVGFDPGPGRVDRG